MLFAHHVPLCANRAQLGPRARREASLQSVAFKSRCRIFVTEDFHAILITTQIATKMPSHLYVSIDPLIFARLAITLSEWEFLQLFGVRREYQPARGAV
jgi:hypothetical protein